METSCVWTRDDDGVFNTQCKNSFFLEEGTPEDNRMGFCCYCGNRLVFTEENTEQDDEHDL